MERNGFRRDGDGNEAGLVAGSVEARVVEAKVFAAECRRVAPGAVMHDVTTFEVHICCLSNSGHPLPPVEVRTFGSSSSADWT